MKKIFSIVCALAIVLSVSAAPVKKAGVAKFAQKQAKELKVQKSLKVEKAAAFAPAAVEKSSFKAASAKKYFAAQPLKAAKVKKEAVDVTIGSWEIEDWGTDGELILYGADNTIAFYFDLIYGGDAEDLVLGKTYTVADVYVSSETGEQYAGVFYDGNWNYGIKELSLVKTVDGEGLVHFSGSVTDSLDAAFTFHYDEEPFVPTGDTITYAINAKAKMDYSAWFEDWTIKADDHVYGFRLDIYSANDESPVGNYTTDDFDLGYTWVEVYSTPDSATAYKAVKATASISTLNDTTFIAASILAEDGVVYQLSAIYTAPKKENEATITATDLVINDTYSSWGIIWAEASNADYAVYVSFTLEEGATSYAGTYTIGDDASGDVTIFAQDSVVVDFYSGTVTLAKAETGYVLTGTVLADNNTEYTLDLKYVLPEPTSEENLTGYGLLYLENNNGSDYWQAMAVNQEGSRGISLLAFTDGTDAGTYGTSDLYARYCYAGKFVGTDTTWYDMVDANITLAVNGEIATLTGTFLCKSEKDAADVVKFTLNLTLQVNDERSAGDPYDNEEKDFIENFASYQIDNQYLATYGDLIIKATNDNGAYVGLDIYIGAGESTLTPGEYTISDSEEPMTLYPGSCDGTNVYYSFFGYTSGEGYITDMWFPVSGSVIVSESGVISIDALNSYGKRILVQLGEWPEGIENADAKAAAVKVVRNGQLVIIKNGVEFNAQGTILK